jgi:hypothetical protein
MGDAGKWSAQAALPAARVRRKLRAGEVPIAIRRTMAHRDARQCAAPDDVQATSVAYTRFLASSY